MKTSLFVPRVLLPVLGLLLGANFPAHAAESKEGETLLLTLIKANDAHVQGALDQPAGGGGRFGGGFGGGRGLGAQFMVFAAAYTSPQSQFYHDAKLLAPMEGFTRNLRQTQFPDGLWGESGNIDSPPDSAFVLKTIAKGQFYLERDGSEATAALRKQMKEVIVSCAEGVRTGGIHTPNHRWAVSTALLHVNQVYPDKKYVDRVEDWLGEGVDVDADGQWAERSPNYTSDVNNPAMMDLGILLRRPALFDGIRRNLEMTLYHVDPNGEVENVASRRQDQREGSRKHVSDYYVPYRYFAIHDGNPRFAAMARRIERDYLTEVGESSTNMSSALTCMLEYPELTKALPAEEALATDYAKVFPLTAMARIRRGDTAATIYGGSDWFLGLGPGSGVATNPTFFNLHKGAAVLQSVRMTPAFFGTGFFYSQGLVAEGNTYRLQQVLQVPYHQPLPQEYRNAQGNYKLSADMGAQGLNGRYFSKLDFSHRPSQFRTLTSKVTVTENHGAFELEFDVDGVNNIAVTIELGFRSGGTFAGVTPTSAPGDFEGRGSGRNATAAQATPKESGAHNYLLKEGTGSYTVGNDKIEFGPGSYSRPPGRMEGESYTWVNGSLVAEGDHVYVTGITPFKYKLTLK